MNNLYIPALLKHEELPDDLVKKFKPIDAQYESTHGANIVAVIECIHKFQPIHKKGIRQLVKVEAHICWDVWTEKNNINPGKDDQTYGISIGGLNTVLAFLERRGLVIITMRRHGKMCYSLKTREAKDYVNLLFNWKMRRFPLRKRAERSFKRVKRLVAEYKAFVEVELCKVCNSQTELILDGHVYERVCKKCGAVFPYEEPAERGRSAYSAGDNPESGRDVGYKEVEFHTSMNKSHNNRRKKPK